METFGDLGIGAYKGGTRERPPAEIGKIVVEI